MKIVQEAPAKVNLTLRIVGRRPDGYHELQSLVVFAGVSDLLELRPSKTLQLEIKGPFARALETGSDNLVIRAAEALRERSAPGQGAKICLSKNLPVASGIGGGSSDAAAALLGLCRLWGLSPEHNELSELALSLGADVPVCLSGKACLMGGIGERITPLSVPPGLWLVLVNPLKPLSTAGVFAARRGGFSKPDQIPLSWESQQAFLSDLAAGANDLQEPASELSPGVRDCLEALMANPACQLSRMSGSGATCFGLFTEASAAQAAQKAIIANHPNWWVAVGPLQEGQGNSGSPIASDSDPPGAK